MIVLLTFVVIETAFIYSVSGCPYLVRLAMSAKRAKANSELKERGSPPHPQDFFPY